MASKMETRWRAGDWVEVKSLEEIARTLDANGALDGLPFMPEMVEYCGGRFRIARPAEKACVEYPGGFYKIRQFRNDDVVLLQGLRCSGADHDGCQRACTLFWKTAWLHPIKDGGPLRAISIDSSQPISPKLNTKVAQDTYFCQSTELAKATEPLSRWRILLKCFREVRSGSRSCTEIAWLIMAPLWRKATRRIPKRRLKGDLNKTPVGNLRLEPGEWVCIKPTTDIAKTLDKKGRNRGLNCDYGMCQFSGGTYRVRNRLDRMISESTGKMRAVEGTVILDGLKCLCWNVLGGCPREDFMYWREVWLDRTGDPSCQSAHSTVKVSSPCGAHSADRTENGPEFAGVEKHSKSM